MGKKRSAVEEGRNSLVGKVAEYSSRGQRMKVRRESAALTFVRRLPATVSDRREKLDGGREKQIAQNQAGQIVSRAELQWRSQM